MPIMLKSSEVQQNFGRVMERSLTEDDIIVERYGRPRVAILGYGRYQRLLQIEQNATSPYLIPPDTSLEAQRRGKVMAAQVRDELRTELEESLEEAMASLRGRP